MALIGAQGANCYFGQEDVRTEGQSILKRSRGTSSAFQIAISDGIQTAATLLACASLSFQIR